jgi:hypothetical protein
MRVDVHPRRVHPNEERLVRLFCAVDKIDDRVADDLVESLHVVLDAWHRVRRQRAFIDDALLADLAPSRLHSRIVGGGGVAVDQIARPDAILQFGRVGVPEGVLHRIQMIKVAEELIEPVYGRQVFVQVAEMVLAELTRRVAHRPHYRGDGRRGIGHTDVGTGLANRGQTRTDRQLAGNEGSAPGGAARLGIIVGEHHALGGKLIQVRRPAGHDAAVIGADVEPADVVAHDDQDIRLLLLRMRRRDQHQPAGQEQPDREGDP